MNTSARTEIRFNENGPGAGAVCAGVPDDASVITIPYSRRRIWACHWKWAFHRANAQRRGKSVHMRRTRARIRSPITVNRKLIRSTFTDCSENRSILDSVERRATHRDRVLMAEQSSSAASNQLCHPKHVDRGSVVDVTSPVGLPDRFSLVFKADGCAFPATSSG